MLFWSFRRSGHISNGDTTDYEQFPPSPSWIGISKGNSLTDDHSLAQSCTKKCVPTDYREGELNKGESTCLDRCAGKFFEVNLKVSEKMQGDAAARQGGGSGFGLGM